MSEDQIKRYVSTSSDACIKVKTIERKLPGSERPILTPVVVRFINGRYQTSDQEEIDAIERCKEFGMRIFPDASYSDAETVAAAQELSKAVAEKTKKNAKSSQEKASLSDAFSAGE